MKRVGHLFEKVIDEETIRTAIKCASRGKRKRKSVQRILNDIDGTTQKIKKMLEDGTFVPSPYKSFEIQDGPRKKQRTIYCPRFYPDQIIHWAVMLVTEPIYMKSMYEFNCGSVPFRGVHYGKRYIERWLQRDVENTQFCMKIDVRKYYPSIDTTILKQKFRTKIKDERLLQLMDAIVDSHEPGLPIGNYTSQWWANFYLEGFDHFVKEKLHLKYFVRYMDDIVIFARDAETLHVALPLIREYLAQIHLSIKDNWQIFQTDNRPLDFMGFKFYRDRTTLRRSNSLRIRRRAKRIYNKNEVTPRDARAFMSYWGWVIHSNSYRFYEKYIKPYVDINKLKEVISLASREQYQARGPCITATI